MTNLGIEEKFNQKNIQFTRTKVGDRYIIEELNKRNWFLGGESSGHIVIFHFMLQVMEFYLLYKF